MTLHWWMHWFWVTAQIVVSLSSPTSETSPTIASELMPSHSSDPVPGMQQAETTRMPYETTETLARLQQSYRIAKAIGIQPTTENSSVESLRQSVTNTESPSPQSRNLQQQQQQRGRIGTTATPGYDRMSKAPRFKTSSPIPVTSEPLPEELTVMPLQEDLYRPGSGSDINNKALDPNAIRREQLQLPPANRSDEGFIEQEPGDSHAIATAASILDAGLIDSTRLGRARGTFTSEFQRDQLSREEQKKEETIKETAVTGTSVTEIATITGSCLAIIILLSTLGSLGFIMYRKKYLNPPQTLNSDKCSNPDSSGYIDDSTIRDNSEEMYSLDNDSFLNSLEAMTIQNYWTDSVKHTKL